MADRKLSSPRPASSNEPLESIEEGRRVSEPSLVEPSRPRMRIVAESESESSESEKSKRTLGVCLSVSLYLVCYLEKKKTPIYCGPISSFFVGLFQLINSFRTFYVGPF